MLKRFASGLLLAASAGGAVAADGALPADVKKFAEQREMCEHFLGEVPDLPQTRAMLMRACDVRLPTRLSDGELDFIAAAIVAAAAEVRG